MIVLIGAAFAAEVAVGGAVELDVVGPIGVGPRFEVTVRLSPKQGGQRLLGAFGVIPTSEFVFLPLSLGWRSTGRIDRFAAPVVGAGMQVQTFAFSDHPVVVRHAWYGEAGARITPREALDVSLVVAPELITFGVPGIGLAVRLGVHFTI